MRSANNSSMQPLIVKQLAYDLTPVAGQALVGHHLKRLAPVFADIDRALPVRTGVATSEVLRGYLGLLAQGKSYFDAIENFRGDAFYKRALGIELLPLSPTLRQQLVAVRAAEGVGQTINVATGLEPTEHGQRALTGWAASLRDDATSCA